MLLRDSVHFDLFSSLFGVSRMDFLSLLLGAFHSGFGMFLRSFARVEFALLVLDYTTLGFILSSQSVMCMGPMLSAFGGSLFGFSSFVLDLLHSDLLLFSRSHS